MSIQVEDLIFSYNQAHKQTLIDIEHWAIKPQQKCFLLGESGSGKTTLLNLLSGIYQPSSGNISVLGENITNMTTRQRDKFRANNIGYIFQQFNLIEYLSAIDNVKLASQFAYNSNYTNIKSRIANLLEALNVSSNDWHKPTYQLSVGQQQRVSIARAFINSPSLIIADEPTSSLDADARNKFMDLLKQLCHENKTTLLFVSHDTYLKKHFDITHRLSEINKAKVS